ncbi:MAG: HAD-IA family hydrolase [Bacillota bacterium]
MKLSGIVTSGRGEAVLFTGLAWVVEQCRTKLGFRPFPGTLNLKINSEELSTVREITLREGVSLVPPTDDFCEARCLPVKIKGILGALVLPLVSGYYQGVVEVIAPVKLKDVLGITDGDELVLDIIGVTQSVARLAIPKAVLFDLDGTLIDTVELYVKIMKEAWLRLGLTPPNRDAIYEIISTGRPFWDFWNELFPPGIRDKHWLRRRCEETLQQVWEEFYLKEARIVEGGREALLVLNRAGIALAVVSSSDKPEETFLVLQRGGIDPHCIFKEIITRRDVQKLKPDPAPILLCTERIGLDPRDCLYVGDSSIDVMAGKNAGTQTVAVLTGAGTRETLAKAAPDLILESVRDLPAALGLDCS